MKFLTPVDHLSDTDRNKSAKFMRMQAFTVAGADGVVSGGFLAAFALLLGASNIHIGILTAIPFAIQPLQLIAVILVERIRMRKIVAVNSYIVAFSLWIPVAAIPLIIDVPHTGAVTLLIIFMAVRGAAIAFVTASWMGWMRDLAPPNAMGTFLARRLRIATIATTITGLASAIFIDWWKANGDPSLEIYGYSIAIIFGSAILGFTSVGFMTRIVEPRMNVPEDHDHTSMIRKLSMPFRDTNFRRLTIFLFSWNFVAQLAVPFFAVYMLLRLELPLTLVAGLGAISQIANVLFLRVWGEMSDQLGSKAILSVSSSLYFLVIIAWTFTTLPERHTGTIPILIILHALLGVATAGVNVATFALRVKLSPQAQSTAYLSVSSLAANVGAGISPLIGGVFADYFSIRSFRISVEWIDPIRVIDLPAFSLQGYDFLFAVAFLLGFIVLALLSRVQEVGEVDKNVVLQELQNLTRENLRALHTVRGLGYVSQFPTASIRYIPKVPGMEVAFGVTAFQISSTTKTMVETALRGGASAQQLRSRINNALTSAITSTRQASKTGVQTAFATTYGAVQAVTTKSSNASQEVTTVISGSMSALKNANMRAADIVKGTVSGAIQAGYAAGYSFNEIGTTAINIARTSAPKLGISTQEATRIAAQAAIQAAEELPLDQQEAARQAIVNEILFDDEDTVNQPSNATQYDDDPTIKLH